MSPLTRDFPRAVHILSASRSDDQDQTPSRFWVNSLGTEPPTTLNLAYSARKGPTSAVIGWCRDSGSPWPPDRVAWPRRRGHGFERRSRSAPWPRRRGHATRWGGRVGGDPGALEGPEVRSNLRSRS